MSAPLLALRSALATNTLTASQQDFLTSALDALLPDFPEPDAVGAIESDDRLARMWIAALYAIQAEGEGAMVSASGTVLAASAAELTALDVSTLPTGQPAAVATYGALFSLQPGAPLQPDMVLASSDPARVWVRGPTLVAFVAMQKPAWHFDASVGNNEGDGSAGAPLATWSEVVRRWGTTGPTIAQPTVFTFHADGSETDPVAFAPVIVSGGGVLLQGSLVEIGSAIIGSYVPRNRAVGTPATIEVGAQVWTPGTIVHDATANAQFFVDADLGAGLARITEPVMLPVTFNPTRTPIAAGDSLQLFRPSRLYLQKLDANDIGTGAGGGCVARQIGWTSEGIGVITAFWNCQECSFDELELQTLSSSARRSAVLSSCWLGTFGGGGQFGGTATFLMGAINGVGNNFADGTVLDGDVLVNLRAHYSGVIVLGAVYFGQWPTNTGGVQGFGRMVVNVSNSGVAAVWGPATIEPNAGQQILLQAVTAAETLLCTGGITINGSATAFPWDPSSAGYGPAVATTPANLDAHQGLTEPASGTSIHF